MFTWIFGSILVPTWLHFTLPNPPKSFKNPTPRAIKILIDFCFDFFSILAPFWGPSWSHVGHLFRAKTPQDAPRTATRRPKTHPRQPKTPQDAPRPPQDAPKAPKTLPRRRFWKDFGDIFEDFGKIFGRLLDLQCLERRGRLYFFDTFRFGAVAGSQLCCAVGLMNRIINKIRSLVGFF